MIESMPTFPVQPAKPPLRVIQRALQARLRDQSGQNLVEMACAVPVFLLLLMGFMGFAIILFDYENANFACKQAARYASLHSSTSLSPCNSTQVAAIVSQFQMASPQTSNISVSWPSGNTIGGTVTVTVNATYPISIPFSTVSSVAISASAQRTITR
jgi:Flp pilus assembly protein TadG